MASSPPVHVAASSLAPPEPPAPEGSSDESGEPSPSARMYERGAARAALDELSEEAGGKLRALDVSIFPDRIRVQAQSQKDRTKVEGWEIRGGQVFGPVPIRLSGAGHLEQNLFSVSAVDLDAIPDVVRQAKSRLSEIEGGQVNYLSVDRDLPFSRQVMFRAFVEGTEERGYADFDAKGRYVRSAKGTPR